jgi:outer membrane protein assembly factor BamA
MLCVVPSLLAAQRFWNSSGAPAAYYSTMDGWWLAGFYKVYSPIGFLERPEPFAAALTVSAGASTEGSRFLELDAQAPAYWDGWRAAVTLGANRANRLGYYGLGNTSAYSEDAVTSTSPYFYRVSRAHWAARATLQRRIAGPLRALGGLTFQRTDYRGLPGESVFEQNVANGVIDGDRIPFTDFALRAGVVLDARDDELDPHGGLFAEALFSRGDGYSRVTGHAQIYVRPFETLTLAARAGGERMTGSPPLAAQMTMESSEYPFVALGGYRTLRGFPNGRFTGHGKLIAGLEARYALIWAPTIFELKLVGFVDAGRVFGPGEAFVLTTKRLHTSGGGEIVLRLTRSSLVVLGAGFSTEGWQLLTATTWSY